PGRRQRRRPNTPTARGIDSLEASGARKRRTVFIGAFTPPLAAHGTRTMLVDTHTNLGWYPDHFSDEFVEFALAAKLAKMKRSPDVYCAANPASLKNAFDATPETLLEATKNCDKVIVFGLMAPYVGLRIPQELISDFVKQHSDRFIGWSSVDPNDRDCIDQ